MAASITVPQFSSALNSSTVLSRPLTPSRGVITLFGYGVSVRVDRGHLIVEDGIGPTRRRARFARIGHGLRRLVVIGSDGMMSLSALRWLADQKAAFVMLERAGKVLLATGPVGPRDARLRRAQALAQHSGIALGISRELIDRKLKAQEHLVRVRLLNDDAAGAIASARSNLQAADTTETVRLYEAQAAMAYWSAWNRIPVSFPTSDLRRVPEHWRTFGARRSLLTGSPRLAVNPPNAILNYLYAILESEARLAAAALGLDPGIGFMHADTGARDSLACDLMEPIRPLVDAHVLDWLTRDRLRREWFFEERNGNCRLMGEFVAELSRTATTWARAVAPIAEWVAATLWATVRTRRKSSGFTTRLTQTHRREAQGGSIPTITAPPRPPRLCRQCGSRRRTGGEYCFDCASASAPDRMRRAAEQGRLAAQTPEAQVRRAETRRRHAKAQREWGPSEQPAWLTESVYAEQIQSRLARLTVPELSAALGVSEPYSAQIRAGRRRPHPRHWRKLAELVGVSSHIG